MEEDMPNLSIEINESIVQVCQMNDSQFNGFVALTNFGNIWRYSTRFDKWTIINPPDFIETYNKI